MTPAPFRLLRMLARLLAETLAIRSQLTRRRKRLDKKHRRRSRRGATSESRV